MRRGIFLRAFGSEGQRDGQFSSPRGVIVDPQGNYVVTDFGNPSCSDYQLSRSRDQEVWVKGERKMVR